MITAQQFAQAVDDCAADIREYEWGADGYAGKCDCIGLIMDALSLLGFQWPGTHGTNWTARNAMRTFGPIQRVADCFLGEVVFKARSPGHEKWKLPDTYKNSPDQNDYYHVGVVTSVNPLCITHCTDVPGGIQRDTKLGAWKYGGKLKYVDYEGSEEPMEYSYRAEVTAPNQFPVRMRDEPDQSGHILEQVPQGTTVDVLGEVSGWCLIRNGAKTGYMMKQFLKPVSGDSEPVDGPSGSAVAVNRADLETVKTALETALNIVDKLLVW